MQKAHIVSKWTENTQNKLFVDEKAFKGLPPVLTATTFYFKHQQ